MQQRIVSASSGSLVGELHTENQHETLIVICHGFNSSSDNDTLVAIVTGLNQAGYDTLSFDFSENLGGFDIASQVRDVAAMVQQTGSYANHILLAASFGALTAAIATRQVPAIKGLITLNGFFGTAMLGKAYRTTYLKFRLAALVIPKYRRILRYYKHGLRPDLITVPALTIHSKADQQVYIRQSRKFFNHLTADKKFIVLESANHGLSSPVDRQLVITEIVNWLGRTF